MHQKLDTFRQFLHRTITITGRELALGAAACTLAGITAGFLLSPPRNSSIGCNNGPRYSSTPASKTAETDSRDSKEA